MVVKYSLGLDISYETFDANFSAIDVEQKVKVIASHKFEYQLNCEKHRTKAASSNWV